MVIDYSVYKGLRFLCYDATETLKQGMTVDDIKSLMKERILRLYEGVYEDSIQFTEYDIMDHHMIRAEFNQDKRYFMFDKCVLD